MTKTIDDYLNNQDLVNEPMALREVHAARLLIQDETKGMTAEERTAYFHESAARFLAPEKPKKESNCGGSAGQRI
jgi:hypothetical protein